ncbi:hypothetical protein [Gracilimonas sediminicola]|uniref:Uncharacterized protein n=1 Tax=Gracilimonas sediminicola TaxID=2952158 RepID=A0A9X2REU8_9BACT|nr:hypothetical protein [Gracilimonas sediminicola]MCP9292256.1 hypothetical protein [Gracilimonas sediminicola]
MEDTFRKALKHTRPYIDIGVMVYDLFGGNNFGSQIDAIPFYLETAKDSAFGYATVVEQENAEALIGRDGSEIVKINKYSQNDLANHPPNYLSIIGAEKDKAPIRMAGQIFEGDDELKDEDGMLKKVDLLNNQYVKRHVNSYDRLLNRYETIYSACKIRYFYNLSKCKESKSDVIDAKYRKGLWKDAKREIDDLGKTWSEIIKSTRRISHTVRIFIPPCSDGGGRFPGQFSTRSFDDDCSQNPEGEFRNTTYYQYIADKNDGVVNIHNALWHSNDTFDDLNNIYMKDVHLNADGLDQGGYNHFELRNYARQYKLKENGLVVFKAGDPNPAMDEVRDWIIDRFGSSSN